MKERSGAARSNRVDVDFAVRDARQRATAVLAKHGQPRLPVCPFAMAERRRIEVTRSTSLPHGVLGRLDYHVGESRATVTLAARVGNERMMRFTMAHELGHFEIDGHFDILFVDGRSSHENTGEYAADALHERQADAFASELLMPRKECLEFLRPIPAQDDGLTAILALAERCEVSRHAAANRFIDLVERPTALLVSLGGVVQYCARSQELLGRHRKNEIATIAKGSKLPVHSLAARMTGVEVSAAHRPNAIDGRWDHWFERGGRGEIQEEALGLGSCGKVLTILTDNAWDTESDDVGEQGRSDD